MILAEFEPNKVDEFPFVVAKLWRPKDSVNWENLRIYTYGKEVLFGSKADGEAFIEYVKRQKHYDGSSYDNDSEGNPWKVYRISFEEL